MRVIAGKARGKKLLSPQTDKIRPTLDRVKESLFNIIGFEIRDCSFLDLFCGSGAIGIEAISRDADKVYFVDRDSSSIELTQKNIESCKFDSTKYKILKADAFEALNSLANKGIKFDYIFMDPPYGFLDIDKIIEKISQLDLLKSGGLLIAETDIDDSISEEIGKLNKTREKKYSITKLSFYERTEHNG